MKTTETDNYDIKLYIGSREGHDGKPFPRKMLECAVREYLMSKDVFSIRITKCLYMVKEWQESGWEIACVNNPSHPKSLKQLENFMLGMGEFLLDHLKQKRILVVGYWKTYALENE